MEYKCPTITVLQESEKRWLVYDDVSPIVGKGASRESAFKCYDRGLDLLQQKHAGIDTGMNDYLDYLEQQKSGSRNMKKPTIDLIDLKTEIKNGTFNVFVNRDKVYIEDSQNGECIMVCDLKEQAEQKVVW